MDIDVIQPQLKLFSEYMMDSIESSDISSENITLVVSLQKEVGKFKCVWDDDDCSDDYSVKDYINCTVIVEAQATNVSNCSGFHFDWEIVHAHNKVKINFDENGLYSNKIYIYINNVSRIGQMGKYLCSSLRHNEWSWVFVFVDMKQNDTGRWPSIYVTPNEATAIGFF